MVKNGAIDTIVYTSGDKNVSTLNIPSGEYVHSESFINEKSLIESIIKTSGNSQEIMSGEKNSTNTIKNDTEKNNNNQESGDSVIITENKNDDYGEENTIRSGENMPDTIIEVPTKEKDPEQFVISSDPQTSNQEKQEILTEIDEALKGLLEAVGKVEIVDEDKLNASLDREVDKP